MPAPGFFVFCSQLGISKRINQRDFGALMVQRPAHFVNIAILVQQLDGVNLSRGMCADVLRQPESPRRSFKVFPNRLATSVLSGVCAMLENIKPAGLPFIRKSVIWVHHT